MWLHGGCSGHPIPQCTRATTSWVTVSRFWPSLGFGPAGRESQRQGETLRVVQDPPRPGHKEPMLCAGLIHRQSHRRPKDFSQVPKPSSLSSPRPGNCRYALEQLTTFGITCSFQTSKASPGLPFISLTTSQDWAAAVSSAKHLLIHHSPQAPPLPIVLPTLSIQWCWPPGPRTGCPQLSAPAGLDSPDISHKMLPGHAGGL